MGRRSRSPAGQGAEEGPSLCAQTKEPSGRAWSPTRGQARGVPLSSAGRTRGVQLFDRAARRRLGERREKASNEPGRNSSREQRGVGLCVSVCVSSSSRQKRWGPRPML